MSPLPPTVSLLSSSQDLDASCRRRTRTPIPPQGICHKKKSLKNSFLEVTKGRRASHSCYRGVATESQLEYIHFMWSSFVRLLERALDLSFEYMGTSTIAVGLGLLVFLSMEGY